MGLTGDAGSEWMGFVSISIMSFLVCNANLGILLILPVFVEGGLGKWVEANEVAREVILVTFISFDVLCIAIFVVLMVRKATRGFDGRLVRLGRVSRCTEWLDYKDFEAGITVVVEHTCSRGMVL
jgi:hypothetical protein